jgi:response regulator RpfG family c-di-GMP phosphodiesterase
MTERILAVDDEPLLLRTYLRTLGEQFNLVTAESGEAALALLEANEYAILLSDLKMPGMDGVSLLRAARDVRPDAVRMLISGHADMGDAINSVNTAGVFRLMLKPCPSEQLGAALRSGLEQYRLVTAEKELLQGTLNGAIQTLTDILATLDESAYGKAQLRRQLAREVALTLKQPTWTFEMAALLAEIGRATLPPILNGKLATKSPLTPSERQLLERLPEFSSKLLKNIPRIECVVDAVLYQAKHFDGRGFPRDAVAARDIPVAARVLHAVNALLHLVDAGSEPATAINILKTEPQRYDPSVVAALYPCIAILATSHGPTATADRGQLTLAELAPGMVLLADVVTTEGIVVLGAGTRLTDVYVQRVRNFAQLNSVVEPVLVEIPEDSPESAAEALRLYHSTRKGAPIVASAWRC